MHEDVELCRVVLRRADTAVNHGYVVPPCMPAGHGYLPSIGVHGYRDTAIARRGIAATLGAPSEQEPCAGARGFHGDPGPDPEIPELGKEGSQADPSLHRGSEATWDRRPIPVNRIHGR